MNPSQAQEWRYPLEVTFWSQWPEQEAEAISKRTKAAKARGISWAAAASPLNFANIAAAGRQARTAQATKTAAGILPTIRGFRPPAQPRSARSPPN